jgi:predicted acetyltransferase
MGETIDLPVTVSVAAPHERAAIENLFQLYVHDFSEQWSDQDRGEVSDLGLFEPYPYLALYWEAPGRTPLLIRRGGHLAGFALVNGVAHSGRPLDRSVAEFFVLRKHRRGGTGLKAAHAIFALWSGQWEAAVARRNTGALAFWRKAVASAPGVSDIEELDTADDHWDGTILRFRIGGAA